MVFSLPGCRANIAKTPVASGEELKTIFERFLNSDIYAEISKAQILGREVPLLIPWNGQIMEGVIDLIYERKGLLYLADYKTDRIEGKDLRLQRGTLPPTS